jgi:hypothetical protein
MPQPDDQPQDPTPPTRHNLHKGTKAERDQHKKVPSPPGADTELYECPGCGTPRPAFCISRVKGNQWLGDCCISEKRRNGKGHEVDDD